MSPLALPKKIFDAALQHRVPRILAAASYRDRKWWVTQQGKLHFGGFVVGLEVVDC